MTALVILLPFQIEAVRFAEPRQHAMLGGKPVKELRGDQFGERDMKRPTQLPVRLRR